MSLENQSLINDNQKHEELKIRNERIQSQANNQISGKIVEMEEEAKNMKANFYREIQERDREIFDNRHFIAKLQNDVNYFQGSSAACQDQLNFANQQKAMAQHQK